MSAHLESQTIALLNADIAGFGRGVLRMRGERILSVGSPAEPGDLGMDLRGDRVVPGLVNAHDHLQLNHFPRLRYRARYANASEWVSDIEARRAVDPVLAGCSALPRADRLVAGGIKNLLSGVTTVAHHDALFPDLSSPGFPVHVLSRYGWSHSLQIDGAENVRASHGATPRDMPWFIHAGEGTDPAAADEAAQLDALGVLGPNTVLIHGIAFDPAVRARLIALRVSLVWCPASNDYLYGRGAEVGDFATAGLLALGSDSRLTGARDLLDELQFARRTGALGDDRLESLVTADGARILGLADRGVLRAGAIADLVVLPRDARLWELRRADLRCLITRGAMRCGDADYADVLLPAAGVPATIDGRSKRLSACLATALARSSIGEPDVELASGAIRAA